MYKIVELKVKNFIIFDDINITFDNSKLYIIQGEYINNKNRSNGSGKTALTQAIIFGLFGITFRNIVKENKKNTIVYIKLIDENNNIIEILRTKKSNATSLKLKINNKIKSFIKKRDKQQYLNTILLNNANTELYFRTIFFTNYLNNLHFINLTPSKQINVIEQLLNFTILDKIYDKIREREQKYKYEIEKYKNNIEILKNEVKKHKKTNIQYISNNILLEEKNEITKIKKDIKQINVNIDIINNKINNFNSITNLTERFLSHIKEEKTCPVCHSKLNDNIIKKLVLEYKKSNEYLNLKMKLEKLNYQKNDLENMLSFKIQNIKKMSRIKENEDNILKEKISQLKTQINKYKKKVSELKEKLDEYIYLHSIFSTRSKVRINIIQEYLKLLSEQTLSYLKQYNPQIKSFNIIIDNNKSKKLSTLRILKDNIDISNLSEGEKTKVQISIILSFIYMLFTIYKCNLGMIFFDEIFNTLDQDTLNITLQILKSFADSNKFQIFVITHNKINVNNFDKMIKIYRYNDYSIVKNVNII